MSSITSHELDMKAMRERIKIQREAVKDAGAILSHAASRELKALDKLNTARALYKPTSELKEKYFEYHRAAVEARLNYWQERNLLETLESLEGMQS